jgi:O-antigen ligase
MLAMVMISFTPFQPAGSGETGGNIVNQLGYGSLGAVAIGSLVLFSTSRVVAALFSPSLLLLIALALVSVFHAADPASAGRAMAFTLIGILAMAAVLAIPRDADAFSTVLERAGLIVVILCYVGLVIFPNEALHTADSLEPEHAGLWRGVFTHKNVAAPVMACLSFRALSLMRRGRLRTGGLLFVLSMIFMLNTGSKTTAGLVPVAMVAVTLPGIFGMRLLAVLLLWLAVLGTAVGTLGIVFIEPLREYVSWNFPDMTYTGRTTLWQFAGEMIAQRPWWGYGFESFWSTPFMETVAKPFDAQWDIRGIVHGHNGYLDIAIPMGLPALAVAVWAFIVAPGIDYLRMPPLRENVLLGDFFMMILMFTSLNAFLESFFFRRADPVWLFFVFALMGLRLVARFPVTARRERPAAAQAPAAPRLGAAGVPG